MIIYEPVKRTKPYESNEQIRQLYLKYKDYLDSDIIISRECRSLVRYVRNFLFNREKSHRA